MSPRNTTLDLMSNIGQLCPACGCELRAAPASRRMPIWFYPTLVVLLLFFPLIGWLVDKVGTGIAMATGHGLAAFVVLRAYIKGARPGQARRRCPGCRRTFAVSELPQS
jgi:hypothetical protein